MCRRIVTIVSGTERYPNAQIVGYDMLSNRKLLYIVHHPEFNNANLLYYQEPDANWRHLNLVFNDFWIELQVTFPQHLLDQLIGVGLKLWKFMEEFVQPI